MRISIEGTQDELDKKRPELIKALAGKKFKVHVSPVNEKKPTEARTPVFQAQGEMLEKYDNLFKELLEDIKKDIDGHIK